MKLSTLLSQRQALLRQARLANLAFAYRTMSDFSARAARAGLKGAMNVKHVDLETERYWAALTALDANPSVIEEHFTDEDIMELADVIAFATCSEKLDLTFQLEDVPEKFLAPMRAALEEAGISVEKNSHAVEEPKQS